MCAWRQGIKGENGVLCEQSWGHRTVQAIVRELCAGDLGTWVLDKWDRKGKGFVVKPWRVLMSDNKLDEFGCERQWGGRTVRGSPLNKPRTVA